MISSLAAAADALRRVLANRDIRRAELAWMLGWAAEWAWLVALLVFAYNSGGVVVVGVLGLARTLPAAILAPVLSTLSDRLPRHRVLLGVHSGRAVLIGLAAASVGFGWSEWVVSGQVFLESRMFQQLNPKFQYGPGVVQVEPAFVVS